MKLRLLLFGLCLSVIAPAWGQGGVDVTTLLADTKTFIFSDNQSTVKGYIYEQMEGMTSCCGKDRIYLEVKIDPSGYVLSAKTLTGRNDCFMQSAVDIVKNIKWNTEDFKGGPRSVYFEIKPDISCDGGRANEYAAIEIFNNELLNGTGTATSAPVASTPQPSTPPATQPAATPQPTTPTPTPEPVTPEPEPVSVTSEPVATAPAEEPVMEEPAAAPAEEPQEEAPVAAATPPADEPVVVETVEARTEQPSSPPGSLNRPEEPAVVSLTPTDPPRGQAAVPGEPRELTEEEKQAIADQEAERQRREEEIRQLKDEMARMREQEERVREEARMAAAQRQQEDPYAYNNDYAADDNQYPGGNGGLFPGADDPLPYEGEGDQVGQGEDAPDPAASQEDRIRNDISRIEQQIREMEQKNRDAESAIRQQMQEAERANREIVQLFEEKQRRETEAAELREQRELDRIEEDRRRIERQRDEQTQEIQRMQDQLANLQRDLENKLTDLENQEAEIEQIGAQRQQREQEIQLERALRETEQKKMLEEERLRRMNSGNLLASGGVNAADMPIDFATAADSERYVYLLQQVEMLTNEVNGLRSQLGKEPLPQVDPNARTTTQTPSTGGAAPSINPSFQTPGAKNAAENMSWDDIDFVDPTLTAEDYQIVPKPQPAVTQPARISEPGSPVATNPAAPASQQPAGPNPADANYRPGRGYSSLTGGEHGNTSGPVMGARPYVNGETALKQLVKDNLESGGVCGLAHVIFSVTLKPDGSVLSYRVLSANSAQVQAQMGTIIPNLKFASVDGRYNQTIYQEIKAEIVCSEN